MQQHDQHCGDTTQRIQTVQAADSWRILNVSTLGERSLHDNFPATRSGEAACRLLGIAARKKCPVNPLLTAPSWSQQEEIDLLARYE